MSKHPPAKNARKQPSKTENPGQFGVLRQEWRDGEPVWVWASDAEGAA
jgi:hypothetical protein